MKVPTLTPTMTYTPSPTWTPSQTPTTFTCNGRFDGSVTMELDKPTYATFIEYIKFLQWVHNNNNSTTCFGILGYNLIGPGGSGPSGNGTYPFNSQWSASGVPSKLLTIYAGCWGPGGQPCAGSQSSAQQEAYVHDNPYVINQPGVYTIYYMVCYSNFYDCQNPNAHPNWAQLSVVQFTAINWTQSAPSGTAVSQTPSPTPSASETNQPVCYLITNDPRGIYLSCDTPHLKERQLLRH